VISGAFNNKSVHFVGVIIVCIRVFGLRTVTEDHLGDEGVNGGLISKRTLHKLSGTIWISFSRLMMGMTVGNLGTR
jgi:hypothetical protein